MPTAPSRLAAARLIFRRLLIGLGVLLVGPAGHPVPELAAQRAGGLPVPRLPGFPVRMGEITLLNRDQDLFGMPTDIAVRRDGSICATDMGFHRVTCIDSAGRLLFASGRQGQGPGEYSLPYRLGAFPDGALLIVDIGTQRLTRLDPRGKYVQSWALPLQFRQINAMRVLSDRQVAIAGFTLGPGPSADSAVHIFDLAQGLTHIRSFGPLPTARSRDTYEYWGSGRLNMLSGGRLVYVRGIPNELRVYSPEGRPLRTLAPGAPVSATADEAYEISRALSSESVASSNKLVVAANTAVQLSDALMVVLRTGSKKGRLEEIWWDAVDASSGRLLASARLPSSFMVVDLAAVPVPGTLIAAVRQDDGLLGIVRIRYTLDPMGQ